MYRQIRSLAQSRYVTYRSLAKTAGGNDVALLTIGTGEVDKKPAVLLLSGVNPVRCADTEVTIRIVQRLVRAAETDKEVRKLLHQLADLEDALEAGEVDEAAYERQRAEITKELKSL